MTRRWDEVERLFRFYSQAGLGTNFLLEQEPVGDKVWLPKHFSKRVDTTYLGFFHSKYGEEKTFSNYRIGASALGGAAAAGGFQGSTR